MKRKDAKKLVKAEIKDGNKDRNKLALMLLQEGVTFSSAGSIIAEAFKDAGIVSRTSSAAIEELRADLKKSTLIPDIQTYRDLREVTEAMMDEHGTSKTATMNAVKDQLRAEGHDVPKKVQLGIVKQLTVDYFLENEGKETSISGLHAYLMESIEGVDSDKLKVTAGTDYSFGYCLFNRIAVEDIN